MKVREYILTEDFYSFLRDIERIIRKGDLQECAEMVEHALADTQSGSGEIDKAYIGSLRERKRNSKISDINRMLKEMTLDQIDNVHKYTSDEYDEPNHEAEALDAIIQISRKRKSDRQ